MGFAENAVKTKTPAGLNWLSYCLSAVWTLPRCYTAKASLRVLASLPPQCPVCRPGDCPASAGHRMLGTHSHSEGICEAPGHGGTLEEVIMKCTDPGMPLGRHLFL